MKKRISRIQPVLFFSIFLYSYCCAKIETYKPQVIRPQVMSDEEKEEAVEAAIKETFGTVVANMVTAAQNPELKPQCLSNMIQSFLNLIFTATKHKAILKDEWLEECIKIIYQIDDVTEIRTIIGTLKKNIHEQKN